MNCRKGWSREILVGNFTQKFVSKVYKERREALLLERERSLMPATQPYVEIEKEIRSLNPLIAQVKHELIKVGERWSVANAHPLALLAVEHNLGTEFEALILRHKLSQEYRKTASNLNLDLQHLEWHQQQLMNRMHGGALETLKRQFVRACPYSNCRGFLSTAWKCGMCDNWTCPECHEVRGPDRNAPHECDPNNVATAQMLAKDSRNCPKCAALIFKIDGCDQMYCTQCHTAFSWRRGTIETGRIHNPHYYEYQRARGTLAREPGDVPCGGLPDWHTVSRLVGGANPCYAAVAAAHRSYPHIQYVLLPRYTPDIRTDNRDLRIKFMIGDISEDEFKRKIQQREKARERKTDIRMVLEMYQAVLADLFQALVSDRNVDALHESLVQLRGHVNSTLGVVSKRWNSCVVPKIRENFSF
jgi:hypothetical protein